MDYKTKKILIIGSNEKFTLEKMYFRALKNLKYTVRIYHTGNTIKNRYISFIEKYLSFIGNFFIRKLFISFISKAKNKYDLIIIVKGLYITKNFILNIKKISPKSKIINIYPDDPTNTSIRNISNKNVIECIELFDFFCHYSEEVMKKIKRLKPKSKLLYLPLGYDELFHKRYKKNIKDIKKYKDTVNFIGSYDNERFNILRSLNYKNLLIAGSNWKNIESLQKPIFEKELSTIISNSLVSINILRDQCKNSHNMKTFEIPAMGGLMLTTRSKQQNFFFKEGKECLMFSGKRELQKKIKYIIKNKKKIQEFKDRAYLKSRRHSYTNRSKYLIKKIFINE
jgi:spore maturation protein CgeB